MKLFKKIPMRFEEKEYEIRVLYDDTMINLVVFLNNHPANGYRHQVKLPKECNVQRLLEKYLVNECNSGRENLRDDYPDFYDKLKTEMGESRFNDDIIYNSEIKSVRKVWLKNSKYLNNLKE